LGAGPLGGTAAGDLAIDGINPTQLDKSDSHTLYFAKSWQAMVDLKLRSSSEGAGAQILYFTRIRVQHEIY
jgi:hypothetical protein